LAISNFSDRINYMKTEKNNLRERLRSALREQNQDKHYCNFQSQKALINLHNFELYKKASCVLAFVSYGTEIKTLQLLETIQTENKAVYIPRTDENQMDFYLLNKDLPYCDQLEEGEFGISVPKASSKKFNTEEIPENTLVIVPGLAFDRFGHRLGRGKGFYDKFLETLLKSKTSKNLLGFVGYCYDFQIIEKVVFENNDISMDYVISDCQTIKIK